MDFPCLPLRILLLIQTAPQDVRHVQLPQEVQVLQESVFHVPHECRPAPYSAVWSATAKPHPRRPDPGPHTHPHPIGSLDPAASEPWATHVLATPPCWLSSHLRLRDLTFRPPRVQLQDH